MRIFVFGFGVKRENYPYYEDSDLSNEDYCVFQPYEEEESRWVSKNQFALEIYVVNPEKSCEEYTIVKYDRWPERYFELGRRVVQLTEDVKIDAEISELDREGLYQIVIHSVSIEREKYDEILEFIRID